MPAGIVAVVEDGFASLDFVDPALKGPALARLIRDGGPGIIETLTRTGTRRLYRVPEGNARAAGLLDAPEPPAPPAPAARRRPRTVTSPRVTEPPA